MARGEISAAKGGFMFPVCRQLQNSPADNDRVSSHKLVTTIEWESR